MGLTDNLSKMLEESKDKYRDTVEMRERFLQMQNRGAVSKQEYDLPLIDVLGISAQYRSK